MVERKHGYKHTAVNGTEFTIKEKHEDTDLSSIGRRLAARDDVTGVNVEYDGVITIHIRSSETWDSEDYTPDGFTVVNVLVHEGGDADAHLDIERDD